jgi:hypothetical protein
VKFSSWAPDSRSRRARIVRWARRRAVRTPRAAAVLPGAFAAF